MEFSSTLDPAVGTYIRIDPGDQAKVRALAAAARAWVETGSSLNIVH